MRRFDGLGEAELRSIIRQCEQALRLMGCYVPAGLVDKEDLRDHLGIDPNSVPDLNALLKEWDSNLYSAYGDELYRIEVEQLDYTLDEIELREGHQSWMDPDCGRLDRRPGNHSTDDGGDAPDEPCRER